MIPKNQLIIAVDFDGTIVDDKYPGIGSEKMFAFETLKELQSKGHRLILWTYRHGRKLDEAVEFCKKNDLEFYAINKSYPEEEFEGEASRKINADIFIDDRNIGGLLGWGEIYQQLLITKKHGENKSKKKKGFFSFLNGVGMF
ncbi:MAG: hydrolase [Flavobacteriaceae bacterium]|nr:hydrolase [Flavobacteriaceae bacterium]